MSSLRDTIINNHTIRKLYQDEFQKLFKLDLQNFWNPFFGFDVLVFDKYLNTPDDVSISEHVISVYGEEAHELILRMINTGKEIDELEREGKKDE